MLFHHVLMPFRYYDFDLRQLVSFYEVARQRSYRRAADQLHIAQSAISRQIQSLENALGSRLFERSYQRVTLTDAGRWMQKKLAAVFPALDEIGATIDNAVIESPVLRIGDDAMTTAEILVPALRALRKKYPNLSVSLNQNTSHGSFQELKEEIIDCALTAAPAPYKDLVSVKVMEQNVGIVVPEGHPLYGVAEVRLSELHDENWILFPRNANPILYDEIISSCHSAGFSPQIVQEVTVRSRAVALAACGIGIATLAEHLKYICIPGTKYVGLSKPTPKMGCYVVHQRGRSDRIIEDFVAQCCGMNSRKRQQARQKKMSDL